MYFTDSHALCILFCSVGRRVNCHCCLSDSSASEVHGRDHHQEWKRQSPIHIVTAATQRSEDLEPLNFTKGWEEPICGTFKNTGYTVSFSPKSSPLTSLRTHVGEYDLDNFHYHWAQSAGCGSEHKVDERRYDLEIHFVFNKVNNTNPRAGDAMAVLGIFGQADPNAEIKGIWKHLMPSHVFPYMSGKEVDDIVCSNLLPKNHDYFYYEGSLTTPGYDEVVQWFILREPIRVPALYLDQLCNIQNDKGDRITRNYRELQDINGRVVKRFELPNKKREK